MSNGLVFDIQRDSEEDGPGLRITVFLKGCPLHCVWCHNPEGIQRHPVAAIPERGQEPIGVWYTPAQLLDQVLPYRPLLCSSGGGVTFSGGEPCLQMSFLSQVLQGLKAEGIHTAVETCGYFALERFRRKIVPWLDLLLFDLKLFDAEESLRQTGRSSQRIVANFRALCRESRIRLKPRIPLIPNVTATEANLTAWGRLLKEVEVQQLSLLPYNPTWMDKARRLGFPVQYGHSTFLTQEQQQRCVQWVLTS